MALSEDGISRQLLYAVGIFVLVGAGVGLTGVVLLTQFTGTDTGGNFISGIFFILIIAISLLFGPVVAAIVGTQLGKRQHSSTAYLATFIGSAAGYFLMMMVILLILLAGLSITSGGGSEAIGEGMSTEGSALGETSGGLGEWLVPILLTSIPTGLTGVGAAYLRIQTSQTTRGSTGPVNSVPKSLPTNWVIVAVLMFILITGGAYGVTSLFSENPASNLEVNGDGYAQGDTLYAQAIIENTGDRDATATLTIRMEFTGQTKEEFTSSREITISGGESRTETIELGQYSELTSSEEDALLNGNWQVEFLINGEVRDTYTE